MIPQLIFLIGIPGSGKSFWIKKVQEKAIDKNSYHIVCPDQIRAQYFKDISDQSSNTRVWDIAKGMTIAYLINKQNVILDATNVNTTYRKEFIKDLSALGKMIAILFDVDPSEACIRIKNDLNAGKNRSNVPDAIIYRMYGEYLYTRSILIEENFEIYTVSQVTFPLYNFFRRYNSDPHHPLE